MSAPLYLSGEVGNVDATTVVITFDQAVALCVTPIPPAPVTHAAGGVVDSQSFADWLSSRPIMGRAFRTPRKRQEESVEVFEPEAQEVDTLKESNNRTAILMALLAIDEEWNE